MDRLDVTALTANGKTLGDMSSGATILNAEVIRNRGNGLSPERRTAIFQRNPDPRGAFLKHFLTQPRFLTQASPAVVFSDYNDLAACIDDECLDMTSDLIFAFINAGTVGGHGIPDTGHTPIQKNSSKPACAN
jgi:dihydroxyacid dehydratase/phosphogluconate dehydratase